MDIILKLFNQNKRVNQILLLFGLYCLSLLLVRAKITHSIYLFFLIWNLFLALIPYAVSTHLLLLKKQKRAKIQILCLSALWLLFIPNSFYIITDLVHLMNSEGVMLWVDLIILSSYALIGFALGLISLFHMEQVAKNLFSKKIVDTIIPLVCLLSGLGIYIGRILRYNSWDIISNPFELVNDILLISTSGRTVLFSIHFGLFIYFSFLIKKRLAN